MKRLLIIAAIAVVSGTITARDIKGVVVDDNDSTTVIGAICLLENGGNILSKIATTETGSFTIEDNLKTESELVVSMTGYSHTQIFIPSGSKDIDLGNIFLSRNLTLDEITVNAQKVIADKQGRTIVFPSSTDVKSSASSLSLFGKLPLPGLEVNSMSRSISVDGGSPVILIDGVPSEMSDVNVLQPKDISRIEYSRITPARYADSGKTGYINIILKRRSDGGSIAAWIRDCPTTAFLDGNIHTTYHQGPSQFSLSYDSGWRNYHKVYDDSYGTLIGDDFKVDLEAHDQNPFNYFINEIRAKYNYRPNNATLFSATFNTTINDSHRRTLANTTDSELGNYDSRVDYKDNSVSPSLNLFLRREFNDKNSLEVEVVGTLSNYDYSRISEYDINETLTTYLNDVKNRRRSLISEVAYIHNFSDKTSLSAGL